MSHNMILSCGSFLPCDNQRNVFSLFRDGIDLGRFLDAADMVNKVKYYLAHPGERSEIAERGYRNVLENHTYIHRIKEILSKIGNRA